MTLKLYESSRWKTFDPMNVNIGITLCSADSGDNLARDAISSRTWWKVLGFSAAVRRDETIWWSINQIEHLLRIRSTSTSNLIVLGARFGSS